MIQKLTLENFAIIDELSLEFFPGLTVITGETGSGKSLIMEALNIGTGGKGDGTYVKNGARTARVMIQTTRFAITRVQYISGRLKSYTDNVPIKESDFKEKVRGLVDFHGQHDQQYILDVHSHIQYLDRFAGLTEKANEISDIFASLHAKRNTLQSLRRKKADLEQQAELNRFRLQEIQAVNPQLGEDETLENEARSYRHFDEILATVNALKMMLVEDEYSVTNQMSDVLRKVQKLTSLDPSIHDYFQEIEALLITVQEIATGLVLHADNIQYDEDRLVEIEERIGQLESLKRKFGGTLASVLIALEEFQKESTTLTEISASIRKHGEEIDNLQDRYQVIAHELHQKRADMIPRLEQKLVSEMEVMNMSGARFEIRNRLRKDEKSFITIAGEPVQALEFGVDSIEFYISANPGIPPLPLIKVASGGEVSRIMLALKTVFNQVDPVPCLVFDEIDAGISGATAGKVASNLKRIAHHRQVLCITHLPQIAKMADHHLHIRKRIDNGSPVVTASYLNPEERKNVIGTLAGAESVKV
ncbi:MAG: DNA repair protein RecN [Fidelibacterota bacterium]